MDSCWLPSLPKITKKTAIKKADMQTTSLQVMLSPSIVTPIKHALIIDFVSLSEYLHVSYCKIIPYFCFIMIFPNRFTIAICQEKLLWVVEQRIYRSNFVQFGHENDLKRSDRRGCFFFVSCLFEVFFW